MDALYAFAALVVAVSVLGIGCLIVLVAIVNDAMDDESIRWHSGVAAIVIIVALICSAIALGYTHVPRSDAHAEKS